MSIRNKIIKGLGYIGIYCYTAIQSYLIGLLFTATPMTMLCAVWSFIASLPEYLVTNFGKIYLLVSLPVAVTVFIYTTVNVHKTESRGKTSASESEDNQQNSDNQ